jgi:adenosylcobinamide-phosphate synthase
VSGTPTSARPAAGASPVAAGLLLGALGDALLGDPRRGHPVAAFGRLATALEHRWWRPSRPAGAAYAGALVAGAAAAGAAAGRLARTPASRTAVTAVATWAVLGGRSLGREATSLADALDRGDLAAARAALPSLCGRDPHALDAAELARAAAESVAENTADAVVAPLFWGAVAGPAGLLGYRAVNTLDAMVGHRCARYERFGWAAARLDDAASWLPARLTAAVTATLAPVVGGSPATAWQTALRYGGAHPSPNSGRCEAAFAGALGVRFGGTNVYAGRVEHRPTLGTGRAPRPGDVRRAVLLSSAVGAAAALLAAAAALAAGAA